MIKILVIGEQCIDRFIYGNVSRLSPEAPIPVLTPIHVIENKGMSGNTVENLKSISSNLNITHWHQNKQIIKTRFVEQKSNHMFIRIDEGEENIDNLNTELLSLIKEFDIVIVSDYNKGFLSLDLLEKIGKLSKLSILDSKSKLTKETIDSFTFIKLNQNEANNNLSLSSNDNILITLGNKGCKFKNKIFPSPNPQETIDVSGAGDTFTASFILKYFETKNEEISICFANEMSSIVVSKRGVVTP